MSDRQRDDAGQYVETVTPENILEVFAHGTTGEPLTAREVADVLDCDRKTAYNKLTTLADNDRVETKKVGARGRIWWLPNPDSDSNPDPEDIQNQSQATNDGDIDIDVANDPVLSMPTKSSGMTDVSAHIDEYVTDAIMTEAYSTDADAHEDDGKRASNNEDTDTANHGR